MRPSENGSRLPRRYVALGDSFTAGAAGSEAASFADRLADLLREANPGLEYTNLAVPGARTLEVLRRELPDAALITATTPDPGRFLRLRERSARRITKAIERINEATRGAAARHAVPCLDFAAHPEALARGNYARDGNHPSAEAAHRAAGAFASVIGLRLGIQLDTQEAI